MAVVELGTWNVRVGYSGDTHCTRSLRALHCPQHPEITDLTTLLLTASLSVSHNAPFSHSSLSSSAHACNVKKCLSSSTWEKSSVDSKQELSYTSLRDDSKSHHTNYSDAYIENNNTDLLSLWSLSSYHANEAVHHAYIRRVHGELLHCSAADPLLLVVPEKWWKVAHRKTLVSLCEGLLECPLPDNNEECDVDITGESNTLKRVHWHGHVNDSTTENSIPAIYCMRPSVCWTFASGLASAIVLDVGHSHSTVAAVLDGYTLTESVSESSIAGSAVTRAMHEHLPEETLCELSQNVRNTLFASIHSSQHRQSKEALFEILSKLKHTYGVVSYGSHALSSSWQSNSISETPCINRVWKMPDGHCIKLTEEVCSKPFELLFSSKNSSINVSNNNNSSNNNNNDTINKNSCANSFNKITNHENHSLHARLEQDDIKSVNVAEMMATCKSQMDVEWQLHRIHHLTAGGCACNSVNFNKRLLNEMKQLDSAYYRYERDQFIHTARSDESAWVGASMVAESSLLEALWITKSEWNECGDEVLYRKLFM